MAKKRVARSSRRTVGTRRSGPAKQARVGGITGAVVEAAVEIGHAAEDIKSSIQHVQKAREKGRRAIAPARRAGKKAVAAVRKRLPRRK